MSCMAKRLTEEEKLWRSYSEKEFQTRVINLARANGWLVAHFHDSRKMVRRGNKYIPVGDLDARGFPDLVIVRDEAIFFWELKKQLGKTTEHQDEWLAALQKCGFEARVIRPSDWCLVEELLA